MGDVLESGQKTQIPSPLFNFLVVINDSPYSLECEARHNDIGIPILLIRAANVEKNKEIEKKLEKLEGVEV